MFWQNPDSKAFNFVVSIRKTEYPETNDKYLAQILHILYDAKSSSKYRYTVDVVKILKIFVDKIFTQYCGCGSNRQLVFQYCALLPTDVFLHADDAEPI